MNRLEWVLGILLVILLLVVVGISAFLWLQPRTAELPEGYEQATAVFASSDDIAPTSVYSGKTARIAYATAQKGVSDWHHDAVLLDANATWPQGTTETELRLGMANWGYTFFSEDTASTALVTVTGDDAQRISENPYSPPAPPAHIGAWQWDSQQAMQRFMDEGGSAFMTEAGTSTMIMQLTTSTGDGRIEWFLSLFSNETGQSFTMRLDATSGEILEAVAQ